MVVTTCTHCLARFRVTPQQLNEKQGQVRCGRCRNVFSGFEALERFPDDDTGTRMLAARDAQIGEATGTLADFEEAADAIGLPPPLAKPVPPRPTPTQEPVPLPSSVMVEPPAPTPSRPMHRPAPALTLEPPERKRPSRAWALGAALLFVILAGELAYGYRAA